jgi:hypothetical protein
MEIASPRYFIKSIAVIVWRQPVFFLQKILEFIRTKISAFVTPLAFVFGQYTEAVDVTYVALAGVAVI